VASRYVRLRANKFRTLHLSAVLGGANAQLHYIGDWALAMVFFPLLLTGVLTTALYNRSVSG